MSKKQNAQRPMYYCVRVYILFIKYNHGKTYSKITQKYITM